MEKSKKTDLQTPEDPIEACAHFSRLIGGDTNLVLHGGGNSSVKASRSDITGQDREAIFVKGSGWDMGSLEVPGLTPLDLPRLKQLLELRELSDVDMMRELSAAKLDPGSPNPSVETLLHAFIPFRAVQHSHADVIVTLTNLAGMNAPDEVVRSIFGDEVIVIPYVMPGFDLAQEVRENWASQFHDGTKGMVLLNHGLFTFGDDSQTAYEMHMQLIGKAEAWLDKEAPVDSRKENALTAEILLTDLARLRSQMSKIAGKPMIVRRHVDDQVADFVQRDDYADLADRPEYQDNSGNPIQSEIDQARYRWLEFYKVKFDGSWYTRLFGKFVLKAQTDFGFLGTYNSNIGNIPFERFYLGGDGMQQYAMDGRETIALRGYENGSLSSRDGSVIYNKFSLELRYPISLKPSASVFALSFLEAGNGFDDFKDYSPFDIKRSAGIGVRVFMPAFGLLGIDFGYGFDSTDFSNTGQASGWQTHFVIGQQF